MLSEPLRTVLTAQWATALDPVNCLKSFPDLSSAAGNETIIYQAFTTQCMLNTNPATSILILPTALLGEVVPLFLFTM